jgi:hypothetical protein
MYRKFTPSSRDGKDDTGSRHIGVVYCGGAVACHSSRVMT